MKPALIIGSGPSVDQLDPGILPKFETFGCNSVYRKFDEWGCAVDNVIITDSQRLSEIGDAYKNFKGRLFIGDQRYISPPYRRYRKLLGRDFTPLKQLTKEHMPDNCLTRRFRFHKFFATTVFQKLQMSFDFEKGLNFGRSVSCSAVQIAAMLEHKLILMTGVDASYPEEKSYFKSMREGVSFVNHTFISNPRLHMEPFFVIAQIYLEKMDVRLVDCTPGGRLRFVEKGILEDFLC